MNFLKRQFRRFCDFVMEMLLLTIIILILGAIGATYFTDFGSKEWFALFIIMLTVSELVVFGIYDTFFDKKRSRDRKGESDEK